MPPSACSKRPCLRLSRAGKGAGLVSEEFAVEKVRRQRPTVHLHERLFPARREIVQTFGDQLLAGSTLADHQDWPLHHRRQRDALEGFQPRRRLANKLWR